MAARAPFSNNSPRADRPQGGAQPGRYTPAELAEARANIAKAFELGGWVTSEGQPVCPQCGKTGRGRVKLHADGGYKCFSAGSCVGRKGGAVDLLVERAGMTFGHAVGALLGRYTPEPDPDRPAVTITTGFGDGFTANDADGIYDALVALGSHEAAVAYYATWHLSADAVAEVGAVRVVDVAKVQRKLTKAFGRDKLIAAGLIVAREGKSDFWVCNDRYPVIEPHRDATGHVVGLQTRPSEAQLERYRAHNEYARARRAALAAGGEFREPTANERYVPKFLSLRGGMPGVHLVGCGWPRLRELPDGATVYLVEGMKDLLAMRTLGFEGYALPGTGVAPPAAVMADLVRFNVALAYDADEGGDQGTEKLYAKLAKFGILADALVERWTVEFPHENVLWTYRGGLEALGLTGDALKTAGKAAKARREADMRCWRKRPPDGMDVTDVVVSRQADAGCACATCVEWRQRADASAATSAATDVPESE